MILVLGSFAQIQPQVVAGGPRLHGPHEAFANIRLVTTTWKGLGFGVYV